jgi:hypothetical protein
MIVSSAIRLAGRLGDGIDLDPLQEPVAQAFGRDPVDLVGGEVDDPALIGIHEVEHLVPSRILDLAGDLLGVFPEFALLFLPEEIAVDLDLLVRDLVEDVLEGQQQGALLPEQHMLVLAAEDDEEDFVLLPKLAGQLEGKDLLEFLQEYPDLVLGRRPFGPDADDDLLALDPEQLGLLGDDLVVELLAGRLEDVLGVGDGVLEALALEFLTLLGQFRPIGLDFVVHGPLSFCSSSSGS